MGTLILIVIIAISWLILLGLMHRREQRWLQHEKTIRWDWYRRTTAAERVEARKYSTTPWRP